MSQDKEDKEVVKGDITTEEVSKNGELSDAHLDKVSGGSGGTELSSVLKTRHDTAKNSISNVR